MWYPNEIAAVGAGLVRSNSDAQYAAGIADLVETMSAYRLWWSEDVENCAQSLILSNPAPAYRTGVAVLAHALGAKNVRLSNFAMITHS